MLLPSLQLHFLLPPRRCCLAQYQLLGSVFKAACLCATTRYEPQHLSNTLWALATGGVPPDDEWLEEYLTVAFVALLKRSLEPQHLANVLWALERLGVMPDQVWPLAAAVRFSLLTTGRTAKLYEDLRAEEERR